MGILYAKNNGDILSLVYMKPIHQSYHIKARIEKVWQALTVPKDIEAWGGGPAKMSAKVGSKFSLWGGDIWGENVEVVKNKRLVQEWMSGEWAKPSIVTFTLNKEKAGTQLVLHHTGVPKDELKDIDDGWRDYYLGPLKEYVENDMQ